MLGKATNEDPRPVGGAANPAQRPSPNAILTPSGKNYTIRPPTASATHPHYPHPFNRLPPINRLAPHVPPHRREQPSPPTAEPLGSTGRNNNDESS